MFVGLGITGGVAALIGSNDSLLTDITESPGLVIAVIFAQLALVLVLSFAINRISVGLATVLFLVYSASPSPSSSSSTRRNRSSPRS
jgi:hypothetical protein